MSLRTFTWMLVILGVAVSAVMLKLKQPKAQEQTAMVANTLRPTATYIVPTVSPIPSATIDYQATIAVANEQVNIAQATANEAMRINALATTEYMALVNEQLRMTQVIEQQDYQVAMLTATMAVTSIPLTMTQQSALNTQIPVRQTEFASQLTATEHVPTQMVAIIRAEQQRVYGDAVQVGTIVGMWSVVLFVIVICGFLYFRWSQEERQLQLLEMREPDPEPVKETVVQMHTNGTGGDYSQTRYVIPCTPEQLTEFAVAITQGHKTMAINQWEGSETLFTRPVILQVRAWARVNDFATPTGDGQLAPTNDFLNFLCAWLDKQALPAEYEFVQIEPETTSPSHVSA